MHKNRIEMCYVHKTVPQEEYKQSAWPTQMHLQESQGLQGEQNNVEYNIYRTKGVKYKDSVGNLSTH